MIKLLNNRISMVAFVWKNGPFSQIADSRQCLWFMLLRVSRAESSQGFGRREKPRQKPPFFQRGAVGTTQVQSAPTCPVTRWLCRTQKNEVEDVKPHASRKTQFQVFSELWRWSYDSEQFLRGVKKFPRLTNIICPLFTSWWLFLWHQSMQAAWLQSWT